MSPKYQGGRPTGEGGGGLDDCPNCAPDCSADTPCDTCCWDADGTKGVCRGDCNQG